MQSRDHFVQGRRAIIGKSTKMQLAFCWVFPIVMVIVALGIGFSSAAVQAQGGGTGSGRTVVDVFYTICSPISETTVCLERDTTVIVPVERVLEVSGGTAGAPGGLVDATLRANTQDSGIATVSGINPAQVSVSEYTWKRSYELKLRGVSPGRTTVTVTGRVDDPINYGYASIRLETTFRIRVMACEYRVNINSIWVINFLGAETILIGVSHNIRLTSSGRQTFKFEPDPALPPFLQWTWSVNRIRGCNSSSGRFDQIAPRITGTIQEDGRLAVSLEYYGVAPPIYGFWDGLCPPPLAGEPCSERPDGHCAVFPPPLLRGEWTPGGLPSGTEGLLFPVGGGTRVTSHPLRGRGGSATGTTIITITPVRVQP